MTRIRLQGAAALASALSDAARGGPTVRAVLVAADAPEPVRALVERAAQCLAGAARAREMIAAPASVSGRERVPAPASAS